MLVASLFVAYSLFVFLFRFTLYRLYHFTPSWKDSILYSIPFVTAIIGLKLSPIIADFLKLKRGKFW